MTKKRLLKFLKEKLMQQINDLRQDIDSVIEEIGKETKSSAGDKFETSREMMNQERERLSSLLNQTQEQLIALNNISESELKNKVDFGSIVSTDRIDFFFAIALGKIDFENQQFMILSLNSPIGSHFRNKVPGDIVQYGGSTYKINSIQ